MCNFIFICIEVDIDIYISYMAIYSACLCCANLPRQVQAAPKKRPNKPADKEDKSEPVAPLTHKEKVVASLEDFLKSAGSARTQSLTLNGLEYADDLAKTMLKHANSVEAIYTEIKKAIKSQTGGEKEFKTFQKKMEDKENTGKKLKATTHHAVLQNLNIVSTGYLQFAVCFFVSIQQFYQTTPAFVHRQLQTHS